MGWFWADSRSERPLASLSTSSSPPPSCPMHNQTKPSSFDSTRNSSSTKPQSACPVKHDESALSQSSRSTPSYISMLNPANYIPRDLSNRREAKEQTIHLALEREASSIPRGDGEGTWEYPSPQQMYNAMLRKGYTDTPAEHVTIMVAVHNFLNEGAWEEIKGWEDRFREGLSKGWEKCARGEEGYAQLSALEALRRGRSDPSPEPKLLRFTGRPNDVTPKARMLSLMAKVYPSQFPDNPPFDRHDWFVQRQLSDGKEKEVRYVIDYYSGPPEPTGEPVFYLDVRPAIDSPTGACERLLRWGGDVWWRASGGSVREELARQKK